MTNKVLPTNGEAMPETDIWGNDPRYAYLEWLHMEARLLRLEIGWDFDFTPCSTFAQSFHFPHDGRSWQGVPKPSTRAVQVLEAVGVNVPLQEPVERRLARLEAAE